MYNVYFHFKSTLIFFVNGGPFGDFGSMFSCIPEVRLFLSKFVPITCLYTAIRLSVFMHVARLKPLYINLIFFSCPPPVWISVIIVLSFHVLRLGRTCNLILLKHYSECWHGDCFMVISIYIIFPTHAALV